MRKLLLTVWLLLPVAGVSYHYGPGQDRLRLDRVAELVNVAEVHAERAARLTASEGQLRALDDWTRAEAAYEDALNLLPHERVDERRSITLEHSKCRMYVSELPEANAALEQLVAELVDDESADTALLDDARRTLANSQYYMTWLMRLEGRGREDWEPPIEAARQTYKLLAQRAESRGDDELLQASREDLEATVRLARMDLTELQGLPLPSQ